MAKCNHNDSEFSVKLADMLERRAIEFARKMERDGMRKEKLARIWEMMDRVNDSVTNR